MRITDLLDAKSIRLDGKVSGKQEAIDTMVELMTASGKIKDKEVYRKGVFAREAEGTTGIGEGIAIPHCKSDSVAKPGLSAMVVKDGVDFDSLDGAPVDLIFLIAAPNTKENVHLEVLSKLSVLLMDEGFTDGLRKAKTVDEFLKVIDDTESKKDAEEAAKQVQPAATGAVTAKLLAVTGCPTGIAHTFMAAENIEKKARAMGCSIKVETRGAGGAKNVLTAEEIAEADAIIVAADTQVPMDRFNGKKVIITKVSDGINKAEALVAKAISGDVPVFKATGASSAEFTGGKESVGRKIYKNLMNGVSHMLPFVVGGGILIALAFLIDGFSVDLNALPEADRSSFGSITPLAAIFMKIGGSAFAFMLPILAGFIAMSIADRPGLALGIVGGYIASQGKSGFLGALIAGFIAGYIIVLLKKVFSALPARLDGVKPILLYPLFGILLTGLAMIKIVEPIVGVINTSLNNGLANMGNTSSILLGILLAGMMSVDMGGPVNKAAYVFGTASIAAGNYNIMAAVMVGGMVPPCAIALATILFKKKFTEDEKKAGPTNFILGLSFITEGAIPFAASDPLRVLPACIIGSALAGAISMAANCTLMAPHGGIFVFPVVGNVLMYLVALVAGTVAGAFMLGILKKTVEN